NMAPINAAVFPLIKKEGLDIKAKDIAENLTEKGLTAIYDGSGSIGRRYARMDEKGTPVCITVDFDTLKDNAVTFRDKDSLKQVRIKIKDIEKTVRETIFKDSKPE
ncbi:MAG: His/Gly/Thr/Pro-type tRNA ligase C-terminal domain-containing protein, partial [archaeon]|nr:His/Gly/Thr/Pro-type tRNA ligase C-terminal domain-containing protein [archaeon]